MNAARLLAHYERVAEAPDAIERLRSFVRELAVRGKLVPQDPDDRQPNLSCDALEESADPLPNSWRFAPLRLLLAEDTRNGYSRRPDEAENGTPILRISAGTTRQDGVVAEEEHKLISGIDGATREQYGLRSGDLLACRFNGNRAYVGKLSLFEDYLKLRPVFPDKLIRIRVASELVAPAFLRLAGDAKSVRREVEAACATTVGNWGISATKLKEVRFPVPPLAEQRRILAKFDELMALCDRLEAARKEREATRDRLTVSGLGRLNSLDPETFRDDAAFVLKALPTLMARKDQIANIRQTILNMAVRGKLVPQDARDEPGDELLARIASHRDERIGGSRRRRGSGNKKLEVAKQAYAAPHGWVWAAFGDITISRDGERIPVSREERATRAKTYDYYGASGAIDKIDGYLFDKPLLLIGEDGANLVNRSTPIAFIARGKYWVNNHAHVIEGLSEQYLRYLELFINATDLKPYVTGTAQPKMSQAKMNSIPVALPPLAEQSRIVTKVDELMAVCDRLEASLGEADQTRSRLLDALLADALGPDLH